MLPYIHFLGRTMPTYGFMMLVGILLSMGLCILRSRRFAPQRSAESVCYQYLILAGSALLGAKIYSLILVWPSLTSNISLLWTDTQLFLQMYVYGGMVFYGGLIGGGICVAVLLLARKTTFSSLETVFLPAVPLVHGIGRIGCFCAGCCYGMPTDSPIGVVYPAGGLAPAGVPLIPVQLFEAAGDFVLCLLLCLPLYHRYGRRLAVYLLGYGCLRFTTECFRGDAARGLAGPLSGAQWISLACIAAGLCITAVLCARALSARRKLPAR